MGGCILPVVINSGSGNQGMTVSLPILEYAKELNASHATLLHALLISNLVALHIKARIGKLSAYCGAVGAAAGASAGIAWLNGLDEKGIDMTISNTLANISGMVCDGAKASCAAKIASALEAAILGYELAKTGRAFPGGDGIIKDDIEDTIAAVGRMAHDGMKETDLEILRIMLDE
jgi:L-cysteine desulfidase